MGALHELADRLEGRVEFLVVYICEAHPIDGWQVKLNLADDVLLSTPETDAARAENATACALNLGIHLPVVIDPIDDPLADAYGAWPDRLYLISRGGTVSYQGGLGPMGFDHEELEAAIRTELGQVSKA